MSNALGRAARADNRQGVVNHNAFPQVNRKRGDGRRFCGAKGVDALAATNRTGHGVKMVNL
jgi:hypothetical protein